MGSSSEHGTTDLKCLFMRDPISMLLILVGHGRSEGPRAYVSDFRIYVDDVFKHCDMMKKKYPNIPMFVFGHSMVTLIFEIFPMIWQKKKASS